MKKLLIPLSLVSLALIPAGCNGNTDNNANVTKALQSSLNEIIATTKKVSNIDENKLVIDELNKSTNINNDYKNNSLYQKNLSNANNKGKLYSYRYRVKKPYTQAKNVSTNSVNKNLINNTKQVNTSDNYNYPDVTNNNYVTDTANNTNRYYTSKYEPRYTDTFANTNSTLTSYLEKIQDLYTICNDTCLASYDAESLQDELINTCNSCNNLLSKVNSGEITLSQNQLETLSAYNTTLQSCIDDLKSCRDCTEDVNMINALKGNFSNNCDTLVAKYLKVLNNLDTNNSYCNNAKCTVTEINNFINSINGKANNTYNSRYYYDNEQKTQNNTQSSQTNLSNTAQSTTASNSAKPTTSNSNTTNTTANNAKTNTQTNGYKTTNTINQNRPTSSNQAQPTRVNYVTAKNNANTQTATTYPYYSASTPTTRPATSTNRTNVTSSTSNNQTTSNMTYNNQKSSATNNTQSSSSATNRQTSANNSLGGGNMTPPPTKRPHHITKDIWPEDIANRQNEQANKPMTLPYYHNENDNVNRQNTRNTHTPAKKFVTNTDTTNKNTTYKTSTQKVRPTTFTGAKIGPQNVRYGQRTNIELI